MVKDKIINNKFILFILVVVFMGFLYLHGTWYRMPDDNLAVLAVSYKNGFVSAGLAGTIYRWFNQILPVDLVNYENTYIYIKQFAGIYYALSVIFIMQVYNKTSEKDRNHMMDILCLFTVFSGGMYCAGSTLGSFDMYQSIVTLIGLILLFSDKEKLSICLLPLLAIGMCFHPSFLFKNLMIWMSVLLYKYGKKKTPIYKYVMVLSAILAVILLVISEWFAFFYRPKAEDLNQFMQLISQHPGELDFSWAERSVRGFSALQPTWGYSYYCHISLVLFLIFFSPYIYFGKKMYIGLKRKDSAFASYYKWMLLGSFMILPEFVLKVRYGFYVYDVILYYLVLLLLMMMDRNPALLSVYEETKNWLREKTVVPAVLLFYPLIFVPFQDASIFYVLEHMAKVIEGR